ncbi:hypothetical protein AXFE_21490 [Acidithrix ferrooxidans]|uniref:Uncharacterized protein n=1 Tax=Acidithrix ferrooxidans TaxID=1280514 RepID=A0A0D8HGP0_9ACTN|nr:hypothetical protein AXFE_21490 [Acidithrix ferrooxidans]
MPLKRSLAFIFYIRLSVFRQILIINQVGLAFMARFTVAVLRFFPVIDEGLIHLYFAP